MNNIKDKIDELCKSFNEFINKMKKPAMVLPSFLLYCSALQRPGESAMDSASRIIKGLDSLGIPTGPNTDGSPNLITAATYLVVKEMIRSRKFDGVTMSVIPKGALQILSTFSGPGGTGSGYGVNVADTIIRGISM